MKKEFYDNCAPVTTSLPVSTIETKINFKDIDECSNVLREISEYAINPLKDIKDYSGSILQKMKRIIYCIKHIEWDYGLNTLTLEFNGNLNIKCHTVLLTDLDSLKSIVGIIRNGIKQD
jgi:hypothetical protein